MGKFYGQKQAQSKDTTTTNYSNIQTNMRVFSSIFFFFFVLLIRNIICTVWDVYFIIVETQVNKQQKSAYTNGGNNNTESKFKSRTGFVVPNRVFVGGICPTATESDLFSLFEKYGAVKACKIVSDQNGSPKGYGFVTFEKAEDVVRLQNDVRECLNLIKLIFHDLNSLCHNFVSQVVHKD